MEFDRDPEEGLEFQEEAWDGGAELREDEDEVESKGWVPEGYTEILIPEMLAHHCELFLATVRALLGVLLQPCDRVVRLLAEDMDWARELVKNVAEVLAMCWSAARTDGYPEGHPDALKVASKHLEWAISNGVVSWEELTDAYWLSILHSNPGAGDSPEDRLYWGNWRKLGTLSNLLHPISSDATVASFGDAVAMWYDSEGVWHSLKEVEIVDNTFGISSPDVRNPGRVESVTVPGFPKDDPRRALYWFKEVQAEDFTFWVPEGDTEDAIFSIVHKLSELTPVRVGLDLEIKLGLHRVRVSRNKWDKITVQVPSVLILQEIAEKDEGLASMVRLAQLTIFHKDGQARFEDLLKHLSRRSRWKLTNIALVLLGQVKPVEIRIKGRVADEWRQLLPPPPPRPANQLPPVVLTMVCRLCGKTAKVIYADGMCPACHRAANPL